MNKINRLSILGALSFALLLSLGTGCSSGGDVFTGGNSGVVDLAVGDKMMNSSPNVGGKILIWYDIMSKLTAGNVGDVGTDAPPPDVTISTTEVHWPARMLFVNGDLIVSNSGEDVSGNNIGNISIYRNYLTLTNNASADVFLDATGSEIGTAKAFAVDNNDLFLSDWGTSGPNSSTVKIFRGIDTLASHDPADVVLDNANSSVIDTRQLFVAGGDLYVANWTHTSTDPCVLIFRGQSGLASFDPPTAILHNNTSFLDLGATQTSGGCRDVVVENDILYVAYGYSDHIFIFNHASTLAADALPDAVLSGFTSGSTLNTPTSMVVYNNTLFVSQHNETNSATGTCCFSTYPNNLPAVLAFLNADSLSDGQSADATLAVAEGISYADRIAFAGNLMFVTGGPDNTNFGGNGGHSSVFIYSVPTQSAILSISTIAGDDTSAANFIMDYPTGLAVTTR